MTDQPDKPVGYKNPPKHSQFRKGGLQPKRAKKKSDVIDVQALLSEPVRVGEGRAARKIHPYELVLMQIAQAAIKGDMRAAKILMELFDQHGCTGQPVESEYNAVLRIPIDYDEDEWRKNLELYGPPPWPFEHNGLPRIQEYRDGLR